MWIGVRGYIGKYTEKLENKCFAIWDLGGYGVVENLRGGCGNISPARQANSENFLKFEKNLKNQPT